MLTVLWYLLMSLPCKLLVLLISQLVVDIIIRQETDYREPSSQLLKYQGIY